MSLPPSSFEEVALSLSLPDVPVLQPPNPPSLRTELTGLYPEGVFLCAPLTVHEDTRSPPGFHFHFHPRLVVTAHLPA